MSHILWINLITDSLPALALGVDANDRRQLMRNSPRRPGESLFARGGLPCTCFYGLLIAGISLAAFFSLPVAALSAAGERVSLAGIRWVLGNNAVLTRSQTYAFTVLGMSQLVHAVGMRDTNTSVFRMDHRENRLMAVAGAVGLMLQVAVTKVPFLVNAFGTAWLSAGEWLMLAGFALFPMVAHEGLVFLEFVQQRRQLKRAVGGRIHSYKRTVQ